MKYILSATLGFGLIAAAPAFAQSQSSTDHQGSAAQGPASNANNQSATGPIAHKLQEDLQQSGFKNVRVMPESFLVRAEDKQGRPVMMIVNPDSVTAITQVSSHNGASGSAGSSGNSPQGLGSNAGHPATNGTNGSPTPPK